MSTYFWDDNDNNNKTNFDAKHQRRCAWFWSIKKSRYSSVHLNNLCKQTGCKYFEQEGQMSLYFKQEGNDVPILLTLATIVYNKRLSKVERVNFDVGIRHFICYALCDIQHVKFSRKRTSLVLKPFGLLFA